MKVSVNDTTIYIDIEGSQQRLRQDILHEVPTIIALHGGPGFDQGYLRPGLAWMAEVAQVVYVDLRGQGRSGRPALGTCTLEQTADDVAAVCALLGIDQPIVFGHSAGGFVALHMALRHPHLPAGLVLCSTSPTLAPIPDPSPPPSLADRGGPAATAAFERVFSGDTSPEAMDEFSRLVAPHYASPSHSRVPGRLLALSSQNTELMRYFFHTLAPGYDLRPDLAAISIQTTVIVGSDDWVCPPSAARAIAEALPHATLTEIADCGHFPFSEQPLAFQEAVLPLLRQLTTT